MPFASPRGRMVGSNSASLAFVFRGVRHAKACDSDCCGDSRRLRPALKSGGDADVAKAVAYGKRVKLYPRSQAADPPATTFVDAIDVVYDSIIPYPHVRRRIL